LTALSGASPRRRRDLIRYGAYALFALVVLGVAGSAARELQYEWDWATFFGKWLTRLLKGLVLTLEVASVALLMALPLGTVVGLCRIARDPVAKWVGTIYVELVRGTPLLVQLMIWYFVLSGPLGLPAFWAGTIGLACFTASYIAEIVRAGIQSIDRGQMEAARSLWLTRLPALRFVILPTAFRRVLLPIARAYRPQLILVSAGFDAHDGDPLAAMRVSTTGFAWMTEALTRLADEVAEGRIALVLEGGYDLGNLAGASRACAETLIDPPTEARHDFGPATDDARTAIERVLREQRQFWPEALEPAPKR